MRKHAFLLLFAMLFYSSEGFCKVIETETKQQKVERISQTSKADIEGLFLHSDVVFLGIVMNVKEKPRTTEATLHAQEIYKGKLDNPFIQVGSDSGKIIMNPDEPKLRVGERAFFFLFQDDKGVWRTVNGLQGKKSVVHQNVYFNPENAFSTVKLKDYTAIIKEISKK